MTNGRQKSGRNTNMRLSIRRQQFCLRKLILNMFRNTEARRTAANMNKRRRSEAPEQRAAALTRGRADIRHRAAEIRRQRKKQLINILQKEPRQKRQQQRNTIHMMRLIIIIPKIFITIITTISLTTMKRKIIFTNIINQNQIESTYKECVRDKLDDRTTTCLTVRCQCLNDGLYITPVVPTGVFYALFIVEIIILKEIFCENT